MDIFDILLDILLKPPQPFIGLFLNKYFAFLRVCQLHQVTYIPEGINTGEISNNDLFARKLSGRIDLDLFCIASLVQFFTFKQRYHIGSNSV